MERSQFRFWNHIVAIAVLVISSLTCLLTIEPTASFWDCGEFIASSYKLEVGHPPGNPVFQLIARFFSMFAGAKGAAMSINAMSALCGGFTIFFLYLTTVWFAGRLVRPDESGRRPLGQAMAIMGAGAVGALAYCFSDTFWFNAVEAEVYSMSSLFTAMVFWCMTKWYDQADRPYSDRWIVLIALLMGLSIGVHLLNLLTIPAMVFMFYYRKREDKAYNAWEYIKIFLISVVILAFILFGIVPWTPKLAGLFDRFFTNTCHLPVNAGAIIFMAVVIALCFWGATRFYDKGKVFLTTATLSLTAILVGFSIFSIVIIRSSVNTPTNENQPDNPYALLRYLNREQYGKAPLLYGQYFGAPYGELEETPYWVVQDGKYKKVDGPIDAEYAPQGKMLFPRMWSNQSESHISFYQSYMGGKGETVNGAKYKKPTMGQNLAFFFDYQIGWMYWRYFMWNFVGRQNDIHSPSPGNVFYGNWESGIAPLDRLRLGPQENAPDILAHNKGKNHYFFLPLLLGLLGLFFQYDKDKRGCWLAFLLFFMMGLAIVLYLNQTPYQVRERDYAYAGSFYAFAIWIGLSVVSLYSWLSKKRESAGLAGAVTAVCLCVPALMAAQNWDDHDRSHRYTAVEMAKNYLNTAGKDGILVTHGDNDTFPLWYAQEVEGVRTDVRIVNTSLLGTDWYIEQMRYAINESAPLPISVPTEQYYYGTNDYVPISDSRGETIPLKNVMAVFRNRNAKVQLDNGERVDYILSRSVSIPVNKENVLKSGIVPASLADSIASEIVLQIPASKNYITKQELFMLDLLSNYQWDRPIDMLMQGGELNIGLKEHLMYNGMAYRLVPFKNTVTSSSLGVVDVDAVAAQAEGYDWSNLGRDDYYVDYQNVYTFMGVIPIRELYLNASDQLLARGDKARSARMLDMAQENVPSCNFPLESICIDFYRNDLTVMGMIDNYYKSDEPDKARDLAERFCAELKKSTEFNMAFYELASDKAELCVNCAYYMADVYRRNGDKALADALLGWLQSAIDAAFPEAIEDKAMEKIEPAA